MVTVAMLGYILWSLTLAGIAWYLASMWGYSNPEKYAICAVASNIVASIIAAIVIFIGALLVGAGAALTQSSTS